MATIAFAALGAAAGASLGGGVLGLSSVVIGRALGATVGRMVDRALLGAGSEPVETGRLDRLRLTGAGEGAALARVQGRLRVPGQVIWAGPFQEHVAREGGKGMPRPRTERYSYSVSLAVALCEGEISGVGRVWADGAEIDARALGMRVYPGSETQLPDPAIEAAEGAGQAPAYRGTAYVVLEALDLTPFGSRVPQLTFEVFRPQDRALPGVTDDPARLVRGVALIPGSGEYVLATDPVVLTSGDAFATHQPVNRVTPDGAVLLPAALDTLALELPKARAVSLVVSWFGDDLRAGDCRVMPKVEQQAQDGLGMAWSVSGIDRAGAGLVAQDGGAPVYGGTPCDTSVVQAIREMAARGMEVMFYPFILMEQLAGNGLPDPWTGAADQPALPWRGRITCSVAPGRDGSPDGTAAAEAEVAAFFGAASAGDFTVAGDAVSYGGPEDGGYRRMVLHYAHLCAVAGGVEAFCVGSELRGLTQVRGADGGFPAVAALRQLAAEVKAILPAAKVGYAADWTEYFGYHPQDGSGDVLFHLDPLWTDPNVDFVGIDNYMPLSDWRDGEAHADAAHGSVHDLDYLRGNVEGGELYDWDYPAPEARAAQLRAPIADGAHGEDWVWRVKDIRGWWSNPHFERVAGVRQETDTGWVPGMKPIRFTEYGCPAIDRGTNQPNVFFDPKSSESAVPHHSSGRRDDVIQMQYLRALLSWWEAPGRNPVSAEYGGPMLDLDHAYAWAWDARPFPAFPNRADHWADAANYPRGHWLNGRAGAMSLGVAVAETCARAGLAPVDVDRLHGLVRGRAVESTETARAALQPLMVAQGFDAVERGGVLSFRSRGLARPEAVAREALVEDAAGDLQLVRAPEAEVAGRLRVAFWDAQGDYDTRTAEAVFPDEAAHRVEQSALALAMLSSEAQAVAERWLAEARIARDGARFALPPSRMDLGAGDVVTLEDGADYRIDRIELTGVQAVQAVRTERETYQPSDTVGAEVRNRPFVPPVPVAPLFLDLPLLAGTEVPHAPHLAVTARPWPGSAAVYSSDADDGYALNRLVPSPATVGVLEGSLARGPVGRLDRVNGLRVRLTTGRLASAGLPALLNGANVAAVGDGSPDRWEVVQFATATLVAPDTWELSDLLRGQAGSDALMPDAWPEGSYFVLLDGAVGQIGLELSERRLARHYRIGPAGRPLDDPFYRHEVLAFDGNGLRPLSPVHLTETVGPGGRSYAWVRRTRIGGDSWEFEDVPLGESVERYRVRVVQDGAVLREVEVATPGWTYADAEIAADGPADAARVEVAQLSDIYGAGPAGRLDVTFPT